MSDSEVTPARADGSSSLDEVIAAYKRDVDRTLLRENLRLTPEQRIRRLSDFLRLTTQLRRADR